MSTLIYRNISVTPKKIIKCFPNIKLTKSFSKSSYVLAKRENCETREKLPHPPSNTTFLQNLLNLSNGEPVAESASMKLRKFKIPRERNTVPSDFVHLKTCYYSKKRLAQTSMSPHGLRHHFDFGKKDFDSVKLIRNELLTVDDAIKETIKAKPIIPEVKSTSAIPTKTNEKTKDECMDFTLY